MKEVLRELEFPKPSGTERKGPESFGQHTRPEAVLPHSTPSLHYPAAEGDDIKGRMAEQDLFPQFGLGLGFRQMMLIVKKQLILLKELELIIYFFLTFPLSFSASTVLVGFYFSFVPTSPCLPITSNK